MKSLDKLSHFLKQYEDDNNTTNDGNSQTAKKYPPVDQWHPTEHLELDMVIKANGEWWYQGNKMTRHKLVSLFASILVVEEVEGKKDYFLKTPIQKARITVEDAPLLVTDVAVIPHDENDDSESYSIEFRTSTDDVVRIDESHVPYFQNYPLNNGQDEMRPYILVRNGLHGLISRPVYYHLMELGELIERGEQTIIRLVSGGQSFDVMYPED